LYCCRHSSNTIPLVAPVSYILSFKVKKNELKTKKILFSVCKKKYALIRDYQLSYFSIPNTIILV
jgi:hypothetical protein